MIMHIVWKWLKMSHLNFCPFTIDLSGSGNTVEPLNFARKVAWDFFYLWFSYTLIIFTADTALFEMNVFQNYIQGLFMVLYGSINPSSIFGKQILK